MRKMYLFLKGIIIGVALVLPGLSGSLMAVLLGMYEEIVGWVRKWRSNIVNLLFLGAGAGIGILLSAKLVLLVCERYPLHSNLFFLGAVAGGFPLLVRNVRGRMNTKAGLVLAPIAFAAIFLMSLVSNQDGNFHVAIAAVTGLKEAGIIIGVGVISCGLMMLPGVSGSVLLILLGHYGTVYNAVSSLSNPASWGQAIPVCLLFAVGAILGIRIVSGIMNAALQRFEGAVQWLILGLTAGTCGALLRVCVKQGIQIFRSVSMTLSVHLLLLVSLLVAFSVGFLATLFAAKLEHRNK